VCVCARAGKRRIRNIAVAAVGARETHTRASERTPLAIYYIICASCSYLNRKPTGYRVSLFCVLCAVADLRKKKKPNSARENYIYLTINWSPTICLLSWKLDIEVWKHSSCRSPNENVLYKSPSKFTLIFLT